MKDLQFAKPETGNASECIPIHDLGTGERTTAPMKLE